MGWFRRPAATAPRVSVLHDGASTAAGGAALLSARRLVTCAHVVNDALGRDLYAAAPPAADALRLAFHGPGSPQYRTARLSVWVPPQWGSSSMVWQGDLAVLELEEPVPGWLSPVVWRDMAEGQTLRAWHGGGEAIAFADTEVKLQEGRFGYLDGQLSGAAIGPGFSGGPLWATDDATVVGLVVAHVMPGDGPMSPQTTVRRSWAVPWQAIRDELERAGAAETVAECTVHQRAYTTAVCGDGSTAGRLTAELWSLLGDPVRRAQHARTLAARLGYEPPAGESAPSVEELAQLLASEERALATLTESLAPTVQGGPSRAGLDRLLALGRLTGTARLLSLDEHLFLLRELTLAAVADAALLPRAAREALRYIVPPSSLSGTRLNPRDLDAAVTELEAYRDGGQPADGIPPVPALLTLVEYVAAATAPPVREALHAWSERVATRLGSHPAALQLRRADAAAWAAYRPSPVVRLVAEISGPPDRYQCALWEVRQDGATASLATADRPRSAAEIARLIREAAENPREECGQGVTHVDILVDREGLQLPFDEWEAASSVEFLPRVPLGVKFRIALRCPEVSARAPRREAELRRRWESAHTGPLVVDESCASPEKVYALLETSHRDTAQVVLHGPRAPREALLQLCLALGVPVVLWDRDAENHEHAHRLDDIAPAGPLHQLPERIQHFRAGQYGAGIPSPARPSLVWENTELPLPGGLELLDPAEGADIR
ncbi:trypsin-like peptidase domain-containing protein [Streptomyces sp. NPDC002730]|uniref:VMAP-C domain-containing protein n=1 Tax=Streptomyces sp. NPDC002730 TaxID=3364662 RepID=UPI003686667F